MPLYTTLFFVHDVPTDMRGAGALLAQGTTHVAVSSDVVADLDIRRGALEKAQGCGFPRWTDLPPDIWAS
jgi:hypothetical protein